MPTILAFERVFLMLQNRLNWKEWTAISYGFLHTGCKMCREEVPLSRHKS